MAITCLLFASSVYADGESRPATKGEMDFMRRVYGAFQQAAPRSGPAGWDETERAAGEVADRVFKGVESGPMRLHYQVKWMDTAKVEAARLKREEAALSPGAAPPQADQARQQRFEELAAQIGAAAERGDMKAMERLQREMDAVGKQMISPAEDAERQRKGEDKAMAPRDVYAKLFFTVNDSWLAFQDNYKGSNKQKPIDGNPAYRLDDNHYRENYVEWVEGNTCVVIGNWKPGARSGQKGVGSSMNLKAPHTRVQSVNVCAQAEPARARALLERIDWNPLKALLGN